MTDANIIGVFRFVVNRSFMNWHVITIPSRFYQSLKECDVGETVAAIITFRGGAPMSGSIRSGWRAGGRYYQIKVRAVGTTRELSHLRLDSFLTVRMSKNDEGWRIELA